MLPDSTVFTVGHSTHPLDHLVDLLRLHAIDGVADVRSTPYSRMPPHFNREAIRDSLKKLGFAYVYLGKELGARSDNPSCYDNGRVNFDRLSTTELFQHGIQRVRAGSEKHRITLLCAEKEPLDCHRTLLVSRELVRLGTPVTHIHADGLLETQEAAMRRLLGQLGLPEQDLFRGLPEMIEGAYAKQALRIAYVDKERSTGATE